MRLKWLLEGVLFEGSLALIPYKSTCQCVKSVTRKCLEEKRTDGEQPNSNTLAVLTSFHSNFTNTKLKKHLAKHDKEYQEFVKLNEEFEKGQSQISYMQSSQPTLKEAFVASQPFPYDHSRALKKAPSVNC